MNLQVGTTILIIPVAVAAVVVYFLIADRLRRRTFARLAALAPEQYTFTFASSASYQSVFAELQRQEIMDPAIPSDDTKPTSGPRWVAASATGVSIRRGFEERPLVTLPWSMIGTIAGEMQLQGGARKVNVPGVVLQLDTTAGELQLVLLSPNPRPNPLTTLTLAREVAIELKRLSGAA